MYNLGGKHIVLGITGSIAAYKGADLASKLTQAGALVDALLTDGATKFVTSLTFAGVTGRPAFTDMYDTPSGAAEVHVELGRRAHAVVVAPASATTIARLAHGLADDMVSLTALATQAPLIVCPAMDAHMWNHPATRANVDVLRDRGALFVGPEAGRLASGHSGTGRLTDTETILGAIRWALGRGGDFAERKIVVSAGGTREPLDPVRYIGNRSSGKMGFACAEAARDRGADVVLVTGPTALPSPYGVEVVRVERAVEMRDAVLAACTGAHALIMSAAVADYQAAQIRPLKMKRAGAGNLTLELVPTPDILAEVGAATAGASPALIRVAFAAETNDLRENALGKLRSKNVRLVVANDVTREGSGFGTDTNEVVLIGEGGEDQLPLMSKYEVAARVLDRVATLLRD